MPDLALSTSPPAPAAGLGATAVVAKAASPLPSAASPAPGDVGRVVASLRARQPDWAATPLAQRLQVIRCFRHLVAADPHFLLRSVSNQPDLPHRRLDVETLTAEVLPLCDACRFLERSAGGLLGERHLGWRGRPAWLWGVASSLQRVPLGLVLILGPSNYPLLLPGVQVLQALTAGNAVALKPGRGSRPAALALAAALEQASLPVGVLTVLDESVDAGLQAIAAGVDKVFLTGSVPAGRAVLRAAAERLTPCVLELSGCDALFVLPSADLDVVARAVIFGLSFNASATCLAPRRVLAIGPGTADQLEHRLRPLLAAVPAARVHPPAAAQARDLIRQAVAQGARLLTGPTAPAADHTSHDDHAETFPAAVVLDATPAMALTRSDVFAPVVSVLAVRDVETALAVEQACPLGLGASIFGNEGEALALAARLQVGSVVVNDLIVPTIDPRLPFAGRRQSGFGATRGREGLLEMTALRTLSVRRRGGRPHLDPPRPQDDRLFTAALRALHGRGWLERCRALVRAVGLARIRDRAVPPSDPTPDARDTTP